MKPLIVITGPTASGKTDVAIRLALELDGEIVCADSRTVYKGLDIGTAKPTVEERAIVPHHLLDCVLPNEPYNLARFQRDARAAIIAIRGRGKVPFLVGGSGLYIDSIVLDYKLGSEPDMARRADLEALSLEQLSAYCDSNNVKLPDNAHNKRYVIRAIEQHGINTKRRSSPDANTFVVAISTDKEVLKHRIQERARLMYKGSLVTEAQTVADEYGWGIAPLQAPAYKPICRLLNNEITQPEAIATLAHDDWQLARKQLTWLRRHDWIHWLELREVESYVRSLITH